MASTSRSDEVPAAEKARKVWTDADTALLERVCATGKMDDGSLATDGKLARAIGCCRRTVIRQRQVRQLVALAGPKEGGLASSCRRARSPRGFGEVLASGSFAEFEGEASDKGRSKAGVHP